LFKELPKEKGALTTAQNLRILKKVYIKMMTLHAPPSWPFKNVLFNPLNTELNPIYHLMALVGAHHIIHFSRIRVNAVIFTLTSALSTKISSIIDCKKEMMTSVHSQKSTGLLTHCGWVTQICVFNMVNLGTSASSP